VCTHQEVVLGIVKDEGDGALDGVQYNFVQVHDVVMAQLAAQLVPSAPRGHPSGPTCGVGGT
jgi:hypothetical protein